MEHLLERAIRIAAKTHKGQKDRFGRPYIIHVMRVTMAGLDREEMILGALHDVLERSELTSEDLAKRGFPSRILKALDHISRTKEEKYEAYIDRVMLNSLSARVKLHDLADKMHLLHVKNLSHADLKRYNRQLAAYNRLNKVVAKARAKMVLIAPVPAPSKESSP